MDELRQDELTYFAVVKFIEIVGEASYMLTAEFREAHPQTIWRDIIAMRNVLVHGYYQVSAKKVVNEDLPTLKEQVALYYSEFRED